MNVAPVRRRLACSVALLSLGLLLVPGAAVASPAADTSAAAPPSATPVGGPRLRGSGVVVDYGPDATSLPDVDAETWIVADATTGEVLAARGPHVLRRPASTLKVLLGLTAIPRLDPTAVYTATYDDAAADGSRVGIVEGATYTVEQLWHGVFLTSGNDAANAIAGANGGMAETLREMNEMAASIGALDTTARTPSGLDAPGQFSSAYDLALIMQSAIELPDFRRYTETLDFRFPGYMPKPGKKRQFFGIASHNPFLTESYPGHIAGKTGYTWQAGRTYVAAAQRKGHTIIVAAMHIIEPTYDAAAKLADWGFANIGKVTPVGRLVQPEDHAPIATQRPVPPPTVGGTSTSPAAGGGGNRGATNAGGDATTVVAVVAPQHWQWGAIAALGGGALMILWLSISRRTHRRRH